ncbi:MAG: hypothetical protein M3Y27_32605 [Acidobacteriota bacterium]|nr:hypothetical protein [Acidobacteriota bacterium]
MRIPMALLVTCVLLSGQVPEGPDPNGHSSEIRLPNGKLQRDEIVKAEYQKSLEDAAELIKLSEELKADLEKNSAFVVSIQTIKRTEEIEKLAKRIRGRMKRG